jgi:hypothetical protein
MGRADRSGSRIAFAPSLPEGHRRHFGSPLALRATDSIPQAERTKIAVRACDESRLESKDSITTFFFTD